MGDVVLITGCSSGIGEATAARLAKAGHTVYATARKPATLADLEKAGCRTLALDVTDSVTMENAVARIEAQHGAIDVLVNNAGYGLYGPIEQLPMSELRRQFETNVFGLVELTQRVLPAMRAKGRGKIINVSSMGGRMTLPGGGAYHASKYAVESLSDALRLEVKPFGIDVVLIEPGPVKTAWVDVAHANQSAVGADGDDPYASYKAAVEAGNDSAYSGHLAFLSSTAEDIAKVIEKAVAAKRPHTRYLIGPVAKSMVMTNALVPDRLRDAAIKLQYKLP